MIQGNEKYAFGHCNVTINNINHQIIQNKSKRRIIYSSSESSQEH